ncbi:hypothetical protein ACF0H5_020023 [Mactra antiquata]
MFAFTVVALLLASYSEAIDTNKIMFQPPPMKNFDLNAWLGPWFYAFRSPPCSWSGANEMTDYESTGRLLKNGVILAKETWRNEICNSLQILVYVKGPGIFTAKDPLGNTFSGTVVVPYTDYKTFTITWGCTKMSALGNKCDDPWINVKTRMIKPGPKIIGQINYHLTRLWGVTVDQLQVVRRQQRCTGMSLGKHGGF